jgi:hypothetical protein
MAIPLSAQVLLSRVRLRPRRWTSRAVERKIRDDARENSLKALSFSVLKIFLVKALSCRAPR